MACGEVVGQSERHCRKNRKKSSGEAHLVVVDVEVLVVVFVL